ncbi:MAG: tyrosine-type recombinase/integrase [Actinomycetota bacterium]|nr:tyrosine-type recombinase/integrase [Actinomycetota bacterium]
MPPQRFHDLRHAAASLWLAPGVNPRMVMKILGHSQISLTLNTYSHVMPELQHDAAKRMHALLTKPSHDASRAVQSVDKSA